jgi:enoyl-[acyl-carrier protein] reductase I
MSKSTINITNLTTTVLITGIANEMSIAYSIAKILAENGVQLYFSYLNDDFKKRVLPIAEKLGFDATHLIKLDVGEPESIKTAFAQLKTSLNGKNLDGLLHSMAYSAKEELRGRFVDTSLDNFLVAMNISCYSLVALTKEAETLMPEGGSILTLTYYGAEKVIPNYNVMGVAKAALETSVRYLAADLGKAKIRVNAISAGPIRTLAASGIAGFRDMLDYVEKNNPLRRNISGDDIGKSALYLLTNLSSGVTGEILHVDGGYNIIGMGTNF